MNQQKLKAGLVERLRHQRVDELQTAPSGPILPSFDPMALAAAIECEMERANIAGFTKLSIHMDTFDAALLARFLRNRVK